MLGYLLGAAPQFEDKSGKPLVGGTIRVCLHGTTTPYITYRDFDGNVNPEDIVLNAAGMATIIASDSHVYDVYCKDRFGVDEWSRLNVKVGESGGGGGEEYYAGTGISINDVNEISVDQTVVALKNEIPAAQVNADWNSNNGVSKILNKPTIPAEQVNADWAADTGKGRILNKPITMPNATGGLRKTLDADDITNGYVEFKISTGGSYTGPYNFTNPAFVLFGKLSQLRYNSGLADNYIDTAEVGLFSEGFVNDHIKYYENTHAELVADNAKGWGVSGWWSLTKDKSLKVYVKLTLTSSATAGDEVFCHFTSGIFGTGLFPY